MEGRDPEASGELSRPVRPRPNSCAVVILTGLGIAGFVFDQLAGV